ncbi:MAG: PorV/PorQ family protein [Bacteroidota bacterium]|nr:PorV/PorQ family protein [Bacteroidota bacterium]
MTRKTLILLPALSLAVLLSVVGPATARAQGAASTAVPFLLISPGARASAMGESGVSVANDASAVFWNPAGLGFQKGMELSLSHSNWLPQFQQSDLFYEYANFKMSIPSINGTVGAALTFLNLGEFEYRDEANNKLGTFKSFEMAFTASYGTRIDEDLSAGIGLRLIHSSLSSVQTANEQGSGQATAVAGDIGVLYRPSKLVLPLLGFDLGDRFGAGFAFSNIGPSITYIDQDQSDPLPTAMRLGLSFDIVREEYNRLTWSTDVTKLIIHKSGVKASDFFTALAKTRLTDWNSYTLGTGLEYWYSDFVALRFGFFHEDPNWGNRRFLTFGAGIRYDIYGFDFSYISTDISSERSPLADTLRFTLSIIWGRSKTTPDDGTKIPADDSKN